MTIRPAAGILAMLILSAAPAAARDVAIPEPLRPWKAWVLERMPEQACPVLPDQSRLCVAYSSLDLDLGDRGGSFRQAVTAYGRQWVALPGDEEGWPASVRSSGGDVPVVLRNGRPMARLPQGEHLLAGSFAWEEMPGALSLPARFARLSLRLRGKAVASPEDDGARLLLEGKAAKPDSAATEVPLTLRVYRKLTDGIPMTLETRIRLSVSGREREIVTGRLLPEGSTPLSIAGDLPVRVESDGRLRAQLLSGDREVTVVSRWLDLPAAAAMERQDSLWPGEEIWTFEARRDIRVVELSGAPLIDPSQSGLPQEWMTLPAYRLAPGDTVRLVEKQRGDPHPQAGNLSLHRKLWLDFDGEGFTQKDRISGELFRRSRLEMRPGFELGRAELGGSPVMITSLEGAAGVEVPAGQLDMLALSRVKRGGRLEATGWAHGFQGMQAELNLPPGWRLIHADGPDRVDDSWLSGWTLWEVFLLCILTLGVLKLAGWQGALLAFFTFVLLSQEEGLDGLLWLNLLAALGLVRVLPEGRLRKAASLYRWASLILLAALWIPFAIVHARKALYPQLDLEGSGRTYGYANVNLLENNTGFRGYSPQPDVTKMEEFEASEEAAAMDEAPAQMPAAPMPRKRAALSARQKAGGYNQGFSDQAQVMQFAKVQTGPGEPAWGWSVANLNWSGPVSESESVRLVLMPPILSRLYRALQAALPGILLLVLGLSAVGRGSPGFPGLGFGRAGRTAMMLLAAAGLLAAPVRAEFPPEGLLKELETRLTAPPDCSPQCVALNAATIALTGDRFRVSLFFDAVDTAVASLPEGGRGQWSLESIRIGEKVAASAARLPGGGLAAVLPPGRHRVTLEGSLLGERLELAFGDNARNVSVEAPAWSVQGLSGRRVEGGTLVFQRREKPAGSGAGESRRALSPDPVLPFVEVHRTLDLGQEWILETRVVRVAPGEGAFAVEIPLLPFEHPLSASMAKDRGRTLVSFQEGQGEASWRSTVDRKETLVFTAGDLARWAEVWQVQATSRWHLETSGLAPTQALPGMGHLTLWRPIPGDSLVVRITEPQAATGPVKTIESANLMHNPGRREGTATLTLSYRAGQGDVGKVTLPEGAQLENLKVNGVPQPLTQREGALALPLQPGLQNVELAWKQKSGIQLVQKTPTVVLGDAAANVSVGLTVPGDRWVLLVGGPSAGPALLLWGVLAVLTVLAWALGRARVTPLGFLDWALLFVGTSTVNVYATAPLLALFLLLRYREKHAASLSPRKHNLAQAALAFVAFVAFSTLVAAVPQGLLSAPDMQITGNGSHAHLLRWFLDRTEGQLPVGWMLSLPLWAYRVAMLAWSLWLAFRLLKWLRWCWERFSAGGFWKESVRAPKPAKPSP